MDRLEELESRVAALERWSGALEQWGAEQVAASKDPPAEISSSQPGVASEPARRSGFQTLEEAGSRLRVETMATTRWGQRERFWVLQTLHETDTGNEAPWEQEHATPSELCVLALTILADQGRAMWVRATLRLGARWRRSWLGRLHSRPAP